jgi:hypothetical protein
MAAATPRRVLRVMIITWSPELLCTDTMTELGYLSNHFFDGSNTHFGINTKALSGTATVALYLASSST